MLERYGGEQIRRSTMQLGVSPPQQLANLFRADDDLRLEVEFIVSSMSSGRRKLGIRASSVPSSQAEPSQTQTTCY